jgi:hypothetical protein
MSLLDDIRQAAQPDRQPCSVGLLLASLEPADAKDLQAALDDTSLGHRVIARVLADHGHDMHEDRLAKHRRGMCACAR